MCHLSTADLYRLELACAPLWKLARDVGDGDFRDVDVRMMIRDEQFDALFAEPQLWAMFSYAVSRWLTADTGLPIDFQVQRQTEANAKHTGPRNPLGHGHRDFAGLGDATPYCEAAALSGPSGEPNEGVAP